jgi:hypothetical protein
MVDPKYAGKRTHKPKTVEEIDFDREIDRLLTRLSALRSVKLVQAFNQVLEMTEDAVKQRGSRRGSLWTRLRSDKKDK